MPIPANTKIILNRYAPKKDAVVDQPGLPAAAGEVAIWAAANINPNLTQSIVGSFRQLFDYAKGNMPAINASVADPVILSMPLGGGDGDIDLDGIPTSDDVRLEIGTSIAAESSSHDLDRTFKRLIERWLEESK